MWDEGTNASSNASGYYPTSSIEDDLLAIFGIDDPRADIAIVNEFVNAPEGRRDGSEQEHEARAREALRRLAYAVAHATRESGAHEVAKCIRSLLWNAAGSSGDTGMSSSSWPGTSSSSAPGTPVRGGAGEDADPQETFETPELVVDDEWIASSRITDPQDGADPKEINTWAFSRLFPAWMTTLPSRVLCRANQAMTGVANAGSWAGSVAMNNPASALALALFGAWAAGYWDVNGAREACATSLGFIFSNDPWAAEACGVARPRGGTWAAASRLAELVGNEVPLIRLIAGQRELAVARLDRNARAAFAVLSILITLVYGGWTGAATHEAHRGKRALKGLMEWVRGQGGGLAVAYDAQKEELRRLWLTNFKSSLAVAVALGAFPSTILSSLLETKDMPERKFPSLARFGLWFYVDFDEHQTYPVTLDQQGGQQAGALLDLPEAERMREDGWLGDRSSPETMAYTAMRAVLISIGATEMALNKPDAPGKALPKEVIDAYTNSMKALGENRGGVQEENLKVLTAIVTSAGETAMDVVGAPPEGGQRGGRRKRRKTRRIPRAKA